MILVLLAPAWAQNATSIQVLAPSVRLTAGDTMTLTAYPLTASGGVTNQTVTWKVDSPSIATIDSTGKLTGVTLGIVRVTASIGNLIHDTMVQVTPDHVAITPESAKLMIGENMQFRAAAYDKQGRALPNVNFAWGITNSFDDGTPGVPYGTITSGGMLTAAYEGVAYVRALYTYTSPTTVEAGMEARIPLYAPFTATAPRPFAVKRIFNATAQARQNPTLRARPTLLWQTPDGRLLFNACLDGVGTALLAYDGSNFQAVVATGTPSNSPGSLVNDLGRHSMSWDGSLLTQQSTSDGNLVQFGTADALQPLLVNNAAAANVESLGGFNLGRNSMASGGYFTFTGYFRIPGTQIYGTGLFRGARGAVSDVLFSQFDTLPELGVSGVTPGDFGIDSNGVAWYFANLPGKLTLYRHDDTRTKFLQVGDTLLGSTLRGFHGSRNSTPSSLIAENGDVLFGVTLNDNSNYLLKYTGANPDSAQPADRLRVNGTTVTLSYRSDGAALIYGNPYNNRGDGAWLWTGGSSLQQIVAINKTQVNGSPIQQIESGVLDDAGAVTLMVSTLASPMMVIRFASPAAAPQVLFQYGDTIPVQVPNELASFVLMGRSGNPMFLAGSNGNASIAEFRDGDLQPLLALGDKVPGGTTFFGGANGAIAQRIANGDLYVVWSGVTVGRYSNGQWDTPLKFPLKMDDGAMAYGPYRIAVNNNGDIAWTSGTDKGDQRVYLTRNGQHQLVCSNGVATPAGAVINGENIYSCDDSFVDDSGRILIRVHMTGEAFQRAYVWNNGAWQLAVKPFETKIGGRTVTNINPIRPAGSHIFANLSTDAGSFVAEWTDAGWSMVFRPTDIMPTGFYFGNLVNNIMEANPNGDFAFAMSAYPSAGLFFQRNGKLSTVLTTGRRTDDGDFLVNILGIDIRQDGMLYLLAVTEKDELVLYSATPTQ